MYNDVQWKNVQWNAQWNEFLRDQFSTKKFQKSIFVTRNFYEIARLDNVLHKAKTEGSSFKYKNSKWYEQNTASSTVSFGALGSPTKKGKNWV